MYDNLSIFDILLPPIYLLGAFVYGYIVTKRNIKKKTEYQYFTLGLMVRVVGAISLGLVYFFYYGGGDTVNYHQSANAFINLFFVDSPEFFKGWLGKFDNYYMFTAETGFPTYKHNDTHSFFVVRLLIPIIALGFKSYFASAILTAVFTYGGLWKLYQTFLSEYPQLKRELAIACLFIPSCVFWGSGLMKDSFTLSAVGWFTYGFYQFFIKGKRSPKFIFILILSAFIILAIKPYIFFALLPGSILWMSNSLINKINHKLIRIMIAPLLFFIGIAGGYVALNQLGDSLGAYKVDSVLDRAVVIQQDMKADYYGGKTFDIGNFDASASGIITKVPSAIFAGIFRPGIWDVQNAVMAVSSLENTYLLLLTIFLLFKLKFFGFFKYVQQNPLIMFSVMFSLFFAFSVGLTVANFGSLVRLRIPELPFFVASLFAIKWHYEQAQKQKYMSSK